MNYLQDMFLNARVIDVETTQLEISSHGGFTASPHCETNRIVSLGAAHDIYGDLETIKTYREENITKYIAALMETLVSTPTMIVGHNLKFDLAYILKAHMRQHHLQLQELKSSLANLWIWDTMVFQYLATNQQDKFPSLEHTAEYWSIPFSKDETVTEAFKMGMGADSIDPMLLDRYLCEDVETTKKVFKRQEEYVFYCYKSDPRVMDYVLSLMQSQLSTLMMEIHGLTIDFPKFETQRDVVNRTLRTVNHDLMLQAGIHRHMVTFNPGSPQQVSRLLYGGTYKEVRDEPVLKDGKPVVYKSGKRAGEIKTKKVTHTLKDTNGMFDIKWMESNGIPKDTSESTLSILKDETTHAWKKEILELLLLWRKLNKDLTTSYGAIEQHYNPSTSAIHSNISHVATKTKRLAASRPNIMNISNKEMDT